MKEVKEENETRETRKAIHCNDEAIQVSQNAIYAIKKKFNHKHWLTLSHFTTQQLINIHSIKYDDRVTL